MIIDASFLITHARLHRVMNSKFLCFVFVLLYVFYIEIIYFYIVTLFCLYYDFTGDLCISCLGVYFTELNALVLILSVWY